jgi:D-alanyl-D-alanine carboxypeptidase
VDANSGRTLYRAEEDGLRHPASITKVMTLYLLFEQLEKGAMTLHTLIPVSEHAAAQEPSKLGIEPGDTIGVEDAIKAVVTRSANDVAVAIAEAIGQDERTFAEMMTRKARELGMSNTLYRNASGLPDDEQLTTARDLSILGRAMEERFPRYFKYFSTRQFEYAGQVIGSHDHLLGRVDGVDGIKTGYTRASGFNLLTSVHRDGRSLIAVVMGGRTAASRDRIMENLIADHIAEASTVRTATRIADTSESEQSAAPRTQRSVPNGLPRPAVVAAKVPARATPTAAEGDAFEDSGEDGAPALRVAAVAWRRDRALAPVPSAPVDKTRVASLSDYPSRPADPSHLGSSPAELGWKKAADAVRKRPESALRNEPLPPVRPTGDEKAVAARVEARAAEGADAGSGKGWMIQIGATDDVAKANALLDKARRKRGSILAEAKPVTEKVRKGEDTFYRARFAGLDSQTAETACRSLKRDGFSCFAARD